MNYTDVITNFWNHHKEIAFQHIDVVLFLFLAHEWDLRNQPEWFGIETRYLEIAVPISRKSLVFSRERLRERGLIDYEAKGGRGTTLYSVCVSSVNTTGNTNDPQSEFCVSDSVSLRNTNSFVLPEETLRETQTETQKKKPFPPYPPIKKNIYSTPTSLNNVNDNNDRFPAGVEMFDLGEIVAKLKCSTEWKESMMRTFHLSETALFKQLDSYPDHCTTLGETRKTINEAKRHFTNWLRKLQESRQLLQSTNETKREDRFSERRGTDPAANRAEDYTATF